MDKARIVEAIDACRPGSNDAKGPELADLASCMEEAPHVTEMYNVVQRLDAVIGAAMEDVPLPEGLEQRLLARLEIGMEPNPSKDAVRAMPADGPHRARRAWIAAVAAGAVAVAASIVVVLCTREQPLTLANIHELAEVWYRQVHTDQLRPLDSAPLRRFPISPVLAASPRGWQPVSTKVAGRIVAYGISAQGGAPATLLVARTRVTGLRTRPPLKPRWTQNRSIAAWQSGEVVYILVVEGPARQYRDFVEGTSRTLAYRDVSPRGYEGPRRDV
jgi:hypothetical protein